MSQRLCSRQRQGVGDDDRVDDVGLQQLDGRVGEHGVRGGDDDARRAGRLERLGGLDDGAAGVDQVVDEQADPAVHVADDLVHRDLVRARAGRGACG